MFCHKCICINDFLHRAYVLFDVFIYDNFVFERV